MTPAVAADGSFSGEFIEGGRGLTGEFSLRGSNGYRLRVEGRDGRVTLTATGPPGTAFYVVAGKVSPERLAANFGRLGLVDVEFRPSRRKRVEVPPSGCKGAPRITRWGTFAGTIRFSGERGFTRARAARVPGYVRSSSPWRCRGHRGGGGTGQRGGSGESGEAPIAFEDLDRHDGLAASAFLVPVGRSEKAFFSAVLVEPRSRVQIARFASAVAPEEAFLCDESLTTATLTPPAPFSGTATFRHAPGEPLSWTGSLSVTFPGTGSIPLVGPRFHPRLFREGEDGTARPAVVEVS